MEKRESARERVARQSYNPGMALNDILSLRDAEIARFKVARAMLAPDQWLPQLHGKRPSTKGATGISEGPKA